MRTYQYVGERVRMRQRKPGWPCRSVSKRELGFILCVYVYVRERRRVDESVVLLNFKEVIWESEGVLSAKSGVDPRGCQ